MCVSFCTLFSRKETAISHAFPLNPVLSHVQYTKNGELLIGESENTFLQRRCKFFCGGNHDIKFVRPGKTWIKVDQITENYLQPTLWMVAALALLAYAKFGKYFV